MYIAVKQLFIMKKTILLGTLMAVFPLMAQEVTFTTQDINTLNASRTIVDMNGDHLDDIVSASSDFLEVFFQQEDGTLEMVTINTEPATYPASWSIAAADFDRNGYTDLLYGAGSGVTFMKANDDGTAYTEMSGNEFVFSQRSNFVDINNDGHLDAFVCHDVDDNVYFLNDGSGNLTFFQGGLSAFPGGNYGSVWIDYDNDRDVDLFLAKCGGGPINEIHRNNGDGTYTEVGDEANLADGVQTWSSAWADYDNDGDMDAWVGASSLGGGFHRLMRNNGDGTFTDVMVGSGLEGFNNTSIENATHDFNNDGYADIVSSNIILYGNGDMTFTIGAPTTFGNGAFGDVNNDGFIDIVNNNTIYYNNGNSNNWIKIYTVGTESNIDGIGARVEISSASGTQIRDVRSGEGFGDMSSLNTHFGLGADDTVDITVYWTSGIIDIVEGVDANQGIEIIEGGTLGLEDTVVDNLILYPNPTSDILNLGTVTDFDNPIYTIFDASGKRVANAKLTSESIDVSYLAQGNYFLRVFDKNLIRTQRFIKK